MTQQSTDNNNEQKLPIQGATSDRVIPVDETATLFAIVDRAQGDNRVNIEEVDDDVFASLMRHNLVVLLNDGTLVPTATGNTVVDRRILKVYPLVPNNTAAGYNQTLSTMTPGATDALINAIDSVAEEFFKNVRPGKKGQLVTAMQRANVFNGLPAAVYSKVFASMKYSHEQKLLANPAPSSADAVFDYVSSVEAFGYDFFVSRMKNFGTSNLKKAVPSENFAIKGYIVQDNDIIFKVEDVYTGNVEEKMLGMEINPSISVFHAIVKQLSA